MWSVHITLEDKKVLLRERKRHTARRVASARYADPSGGVPGVPPPSWTWDGVPPKPRMGYPPRPGMGYPLDLGWGTPLDLEWGTPPDLRWGTPPDLRWGTPPARPGMGYLSYLDLRRGNPPPPTKVEQTHTCKNITSRRTYVRGR